MTSFMECSDCASKPGMPTLCKSCLHNRGVIARLEGQQKHLALVLKKFAELIERHSTFIKVLDNFVDYLRKGP